MTRMIIFTCTRARDATNDAGSHNYEQEELPVLCEEVFLKCRTSITVGVSEGSSLWKDQRDQWDSQQCYQASRQQPGDQATTDRSPAGATPAGHTWSSRLLLSVFTCHADHRAITGNQRAVTWNDAA